MKEFIAYEGLCYTIEWFFDEKGESQTFEYYKKLNEKSRDKTLMLFKRMGDSRKILDITKFRNEGNKIYAFKPQLGSISLILLCWQKAYHNQRVSQEIAKTSR